MRVARPDREPDLEFRVLGTSAPAGSKDTGVVYRKGPNGTKIPVTDNTGKIKTFVKDSSGAAGTSWRGAVAGAGHEAMAGRALFSGPLYVELTLVRQRGPGHFGTGRNAGKLLPSAPAYPAVKPDVIKLTRSTEDALTTVVWQDDSRNVAMHIEKVYADPGEPAGAIIRVWTLPVTVGRVEVPVDQMDLAIA